jgi:MFS family permease
MKPLVVILGVACGGVVGLALGILGAMALGIWSEWANPNDPSAGSVAIVVIATAPAGAMAGAVLGGLLISKRPRLFLMTVLPLAILLLGWYFTMSTLREMDRPRTFVVMLSGTSGAEYVGGTRVDGQLSKLRGKLPASFEYEAKEVELAFALVDPKDGEKIAVEVFVDGTNPHRRSESTSGIHELFVIFGYAEWAGGTSYCGGGDMSPENVAILVKNNEMPPEGIGWSIIKRNR